MFLVGKELALVNVFRLSDLDAVALTGDLFHRALGDILADVDCVVEVADEYEVLVCF